MAIPPGSSERQLRKSSERIAITDPTKGTNQTARPIEPRRTLMLDQSLHSEKIKIELKSFNEAQGAPVLIKNEAADQDDDDDSADNMDGIDEKEQVIKGELVTPSSGIATMKNPQQHLLR